MPTRWISLFLAGVMLTSLVGCSSSPPTSGGSVGADYGGASPAPRPAQNDQPGMSTKQKLVLLAGAAALAYMYNKHKNKKGQGADGQYYRSKNGRVYYRDAQGRAVWVTPPAGGIQVPAHEADTYRRMAPQFEYAGQGSGGGYSRQRGDGY